MSRVYMAMEYVFRFDKKWGPIWKTNLFSIWASSMTLLGLEVLYLQHKAQNLDHIVYTINVGQMCDLTPVAFFFFLNYSLCLKSKSPVMDSSGLYWVHK